MRKYWGLFFQGSPGTPIILEQGLCKSHVLWPLRLYRGYEVGYEVWGLRVESTRLEWVTFVY